MTIDLLIPVYLDTEVLIDLLATVEDGFSLVERVTSEQISRRSSEKSGGADFATTAMFQFFKLGLSGKLGRSTTEGASETTEANKTHTYGSLLHRFRRYLISEGLLMQSIIDDSPEVGSFIEFPGILRPNPFTDAFERLQRILRFADIAMGLEDRVTQTNSSDTNEHRKGQPSRRPPSMSKSQKQSKAIADFLKLVTTDVEREGTSTVVIEHQTSNYRAVVTVFDDYLRDRSMTEVLNREFRIFGKVARHLPAGSGESVDLLASSGVAGFPSEILGQLTSTMKEMVAQTGMQIPTPMAMVHPPVIEIVPIAIYL